MKAPGSQIWRCKVCGKLCDLEADFCDVYHKSYWREYQRRFKEWLERGTPLLDHIPDDDWEQSHLPLDDPRSVWPPHMKGGWYDY